MVMTRPGPAKLARPRLHDVLARTRLFGVLDRARKRPVVWLGAQPGAGKTTLLASYLDARKEKALWYQVDASDADPAAFFYHLRMAVQSLRPGKAGVADPLPLLTPEYLADLRGFALRFFHELFARLGTEAVLVFDNYHEAGEDCAIHRLLAAALEQVPESTGVIVLSRSEPPAEYGPLLAADAIALVDGAQLRHTLQETRAIARKRGVQDAAAVALLHERSNGWAAGLTLLLARAGRQAAAEEHDTAESLQHVFGYFAQRVFDAETGADQHALMQLALLPEISVELAERLTGWALAGRLLERLYKRHLFTDRRRAGAARDGAAGLATATVHVYQFHALFRTFLQHKARTTWSAEEHRDLASRAGHALVASGYRQEALGLFAEAGAWDAYGGALHGLADPTLAQGRRQSLLEWLDRMPAPVRAAQPWLGYWEGRALMQSDPDHAIRILETTRHSFRTVGDVAGQLAAGAAIVQALWYARLGWSEINLLIDDLEPLMGAHASFPTAGVELMTYAALHAALAFCRLTHPAIHPMSQRLLRLVDADAIDWNQRLATATHLMTFLHNAADNERATELIGKVDRLVEQLPASAQNRAFWHVFRAMHELRQANYETAAAGFARAADLARGEGLAHAEFAALQFRSYLELLFRRSEAAQALLARMELHPARSHRDGEMNFYIGRTLLAQQKGDARAALGFAERGLAAVRAVGAPYFLVVYPVSLAGAFADAGQAERAFDLIADARRMARDSYLQTMQAQLLLEEAYIHLARDERDAARAKLAQGLALAARDPAQLAYVHRALALKPVLLFEALGAGIEVDLVRRHIRKWRVRPPAMEVAGWPWPVCVRTLGEFAVLVDDAPVEFGRKAPKKTLALLKAIIAHGGNVSERVLTDLFWSDEEGDAAARSLGAAVQRLRALVGNSDAIIQQGGKLALDRDLVWVDAWAFERALAESGGGAHGKVAAALALYGGSFLAQEEGETWPVPMRERLRSKFIQALADHAAQLEASARHAEAIALYLRGLEADSVVEPFYQGLMRCYHRLDRKPEAISAYRRLRQILSVTLGLQPSAASEKLYQALRLGQ